MLENNKNLFRKIIFFYIYTFFRSIHVTSPCESELRSYSLVTIPRDGNIC